jgi:DNA-binding NtrC family response regulator
MKPKVLLVDDSLEVLSGLRRVLGGNSFEVLTDTSAIHALTLLRSQSVDVVVSDHDMPEMNGATFLAEVRELDPSTVRFMLTGKATLDMAIKAINAGTVDQFFTKPCNHVDLSQAIRRALEHKDLMSEARRLLHQYRLREKELAHLEALHSGILDVELDEMGAILLEDVPMEYEDLLKEMGAAMDGAESSSIDPEA